MAHDEELFEGKYRIAELLGEGGMGVVHAAVNVYSGARIAIKRIVGAEQGLVDRLRGESRVLALLDHANIVRLLDVGPITGPGRGGLYIAMELVEGNSLRALLSVAKKRGKLLDLDLVVPIIVQTAEAMEFAHSKGIYHRDLKPENLMVRPGGQVKVLDFGLAKSPSIGPAPGSSPTNPSSVMGTPRYMAPEQVRGQAIDARTDIYGLGVVLYEAVSGHTPYDKHVDAATTAQEEMGYHLFADPTPIREHVPTCSDGLWNIIVRCLAKDRDDRYPDMRTLATVLRATLVEMVAPVVKARRGPREVRETEPAPMPFVAGAALPFVPAAGVTVPVRREVRETEPPSLAAVPPLPFVRPPEPAGRGKGYTQPMQPSAPTLLARQGRTLPPSSAAPVPAAPVRARPALVSPARTASRRELAPIPTASLLRDKPGARPAASATGRGPDRERSGPSFAFEPTDPGVGSPPAVAPTPARVAPPLEKPRWMKLSPLLALPLAFSLAAVLSFSVSQVRREAARSASAPSASVASTSAPSADTASASASAEIAPPLAPRPEVAVAAATNGAAASAAPSASAAPPAPRSAVPQRRAKQLPGRLGDDLVEPNPFMVRKKQEPKKQEPKKSGAIFGVEP